jgi:hypothetical protein
MKWQEFFPIQTQLSDYFKDTPGITVYSKPRKSFTQIKIILCDWDMSKRYFEKFYHISDKTGQQLLTEILTDFADFKEIWNSPLSKVMREE